METVIAIQEKSGEYQGHPYHFYNVFVSAPDSGERWVKGIAVYKHKVPARVFDSLNVTLGDTVTMVYDRYGRVCDVLVR